MSHHKENILFKYFSLIDRGLYPPINVIFGNILKIKNAVKFKN